MFLGRESQPVLGQPAFEHLRPREYPDTTSLKQPISGFLAQNSVITLDALLDDHGSRNPQIANFETLVILIPASVLQPEHFGRTLDVIVVPVRKCYNVDFLLTWPSNIFADCFL